jgi:hypothetical protein
LNKKLEYDTNIYNLYEVLVHVWVTNLQNLQHVKTQSEFDGYMKNIENIVHYFNDNSKKLARDFGYTSYHYIQYNLNGKVYLARRARVLQINGHYRHIRDKYTSEEEKELFLYFLKKRISDEKKTMKKECDEVQFDEESNDEESP